MRRVGDGSRVGARVQAGRGVWGTLGTSGGGEPGVGARRGSAVGTVAWEMAGPCMVCSVPPGCMQPLDGRAVGTAAQVPKAKRHDHLPGAQGSCNAACLPPPSASRRRVHQLMPRSRSRSSACSRTLRSPCAAVSSRDRNRRASWRVRETWRSCRVRATPLSSPKRGAFDGP